MKQILFGAVTCCVCCLAADAHAGDVGLSFEGRGIGDTVRILYRNPERNLEYRGQYFAGQRLFRVESSDIERLSPGQLVKTFSIDLFHETGSGQAEVEGFGLNAEGWWENPLPNLNGSRRAMISHLYAIRYHQVQRFGSIQAAAFQVALWEIATETNANRFSLMDGKFQVLRANPNVMTIAQRYLDFTLEAFENDELRKFHLFGADFLDDFEAQLMVIPTPTALLMGAAGLGMVGLRRRRSR